MTRSSTPELTGTGPRRLRAILFIPISSSRTVHLAQQLAEPLAGAHHAHLERRYTNSRELRHLLVSQILDVLQQKRFPLLQTQPLQRSIDLFAPGGLLGGMLLRRIEKRHLVRDERTRSTAAPCADRA